MVRNNKSPIRIGEILILTLILTYEKTILMKSISRSVPN